jgi:hypothetical protein
VHTLDTCAYAGYLCASDSLFVLNVQERNLKIFADCPGFFSDPKRNYRCLVERVRAGTELTLIYPSLVVPILSCQYYWCVASTMTLSGTAVLPVRCVFSCPSALLPVLFSLFSEDSAFILMISCASPDECHSYGCCYLAGF